MLVEVISLMVAANPRVGEATEVAGGPKAASSADRPPNKQKGLAIFAFQKLTGPNLYYIV